MARRDFRQFGLADSIVQRRGKKTAWLERLDAAIDWADLEAIVAGIYASREGGLAYPLLTYVKLLLLQQWYGLSDEGLEAAVDDRLSFRRFAGIPLSESVPDHSSVWRFREELARRGLAERLLAEVNRQLDAKGRRPAAGENCGAKPHLRLTNDPAPGHADRRHHPRGRGAAAGGRCRGGVAARPAGGGDEEERQGPGRVQSARRGRRGEGGGPRGGGGAPRRPPPPPRPPTPPGGP